MLVSPGSENRFLVRLKPIAILKIEFAIWFNMWQMELTKPLDSTISFIHSVDLVSTDVGQWLYDSVQLLFQHGELIFHRSDSTTFEKSTTNRTHTHNVLHYNNLLAVRQSEIIKLTKINDCPCKFENNHM